MVYRPEIDGLRFLAVLLVIGFHTFPKIIFSGFIGVDIFFVISGYLITLIILDDLQKQKFTLTNFYLRRIYRIFPALLLLITTFLLLGLLNLTPRELFLYSSHSLASLLFYENFQLIGELTNYFDEIADKKLLLQLWSLSIEEQFYLFFPFVILIFSKSYKSILILLITISIFYFLSLEKAISYLLTISRIWEILLGCLSASIFYKYPQIIENEKYSNLRNIVSIFSILLILYAGIFLKNIEGNFYWNSFIASLSTVILLATFSAGPIQKLFSSKMMRAGGLISYPLYLWQWSILSFFKILEGTILPYWLLWLSIFLSLIISYLTYHFVELRFKKISKISTYFLLIWWGTLIIIFASIKSLEGFPKRFDLTNLPLIPIDTYDLTKETDLCNMLYPQFKNYCSISRLNQPEILLIGDSHVEDLFIGLSEKSSATIMKITGGLCRPYLGNTTQIIPNNFCKPLMEDAINFALTTNSVNTVMLSFFKTTEDNLIKKEDILATLEKLIAKNKTVIILLDRPELLIDAKECIKVRPWKIISAIKDCSIDFGIVKDQKQGFRKTIFELNLNKPNLNLIDQENFFCNNSFCFSKINNTSLYRDSHHLSMDGSRYVIDNLAKSPKIQKILKVE